MFLRKLVVMVVPLALCALVCVVLIIWIWRLRKKLNELDVVPNENQVTV